MELEIQWEAASFAAGSLEGYANRLAVTLKIERHGMATTDEILASAKKLGEMIASHEASKSLNTAIEKLNKDIDAQRAVNDYERTVQMVAQKQAAGQPIEVADKHRLEELQQAMMTNLTLGLVQKAQMDYLDMKRKAFEAIDHEAEPQVEAPPSPAGPVPSAGPSPIIT